MKAFFVFSSGCSSWNPDWHYAHGGLAHSASFDLTVEFLLIHVASCPRCVYVGDITSGGRMGIERRTRAERRQFDFGPPSNCAERRKRTERRLPIAEETAVSAADFAAYFATAAKAPTANDYLLDQAAEVLDRVRERY